MHGACAGFALLLLILALVFLVWAPPRKFNRRCKTTMGCCTFLLFFSIFLLFAAMAMPTSSGYSGDYPGNYAFYPM